MGYLGPQPGSKERQPTSFRQGPGYLTQLPPAHPPFCLPPSPKKKQSARKVPSLKYCFFPFLSQIPKSPVGWEQNLNSRWSTSSPRGDTAQADEPWLGEKAVAGGGAQDWASSNSVRWPRPGKGVVFGDQSRPASLGRAEFRVTAQGFPQDIPRSLIPQERRDALGSKGSQGEWGVPGRALPP